MTQTATTTRAPRTSHAAFQASDRLAGHLQQLLVDLTDLHLQGKQAHWNVVGKNFRDMHLVLDEVVEAARGFSDDIAERMRAVYATPDARSATIAAQTSLPEFPAGEVNTGDCVDLIVAAIYAVAGTGRRIHDEVDEEDPTTADLIHTVLERLEQLAWMIDSENRVANSARPRSWSE
ncbi:starvation-inducible DNA-binding protein [Nocardioides cavernae]|uniref:Starvation-inducible DNA-binding protein n=1 Tax=Nocardioides cavernae TaxID=1921566 RepID=A0A7Y9H0A1_9ACTN|nr:DNA starvation/stationary phase protection protein [Nocardioides cavernae]NYE35615.1 starvation-inducible DNA-binding protein [Nocardioides cavernae]